MTTTHHPEDKLTPTLEEKEAGIAKAKEEQLAICKRVLEKEALREKLRLEGKLKKRK